MDKVIIDKVDVSECEHYRAEIETKMPYGEYETLKDKCHYSGIEVIQNCKGNKGCIYKQLKRLQAEYNDLHLNYAGCKTANTGLQELNEKLQAENEQLKKLKFKSDGIELLQDANLNLHNANVKYRQALQEIRELIKKLDLSLGCAYGDYDCDNCSDINEETVCKIKLQNIILAKINEVIGAE